MPGQPEDWRLRGQERYLQGVTLVRRCYRAYRGNPNWDHDHCEFCSTKFTMQDAPTGYATKDDYRWICETCFGDFKERFEWHVVPAGDAEDDAVKLPAAERAIVEPSKVRDYLLSESHPVGSSGATRGRTRRLLRKPVATGRSMRCVVAWKAQRAERRLSSQCGSSFAAKTSPAS